MVPALGQVRRQAPNVWNGLLFVKLLIAAACKQARDSLL